MMNRRRFLTVAGGTAAVAAVSRRLWALGTLEHAAREKIKVYLSPTCDCCAKWVEHVKKAGFEVETEQVSDVDPTKRKLNVPEKLWSCHTAVVGGYAIEGHVPASAIRRLLRDKPSVVGIAVAGMPMGAPGMEHGEHKEAFDVRSFTCCGDINVFVKH